MIHASEKTDFLRSDGKDHLSDQKDTCYRMKQSAMLFRNEKIDNEHQDESDYESGFLTHMYELRKAFHRLI